MAAIKYVETGTLLFSLLLGWDDLLHAQKSRTIGVLSGSSPKASDSLTKVFRRQLQELGYIEGRDVVFQYQHANGELGKLPELAASLVNNKVDVIVAHAPAAVRAAKNATSDIPIVMAHGGDPVAQGFVVSLARPGENVTGLSNFSAELSGKRLELLKEAFSKASPAAVIWNPDAPGSRLGFQELDIAAKQMSLSLDPIGVRSERDFNDAFRQARKRARSLVVIQDILTVTHMKEVVGLALESRLPAIYMEKVWAEAGGLMSYGVDQLELHRRAATYVYRILKGTKPADLPVEQPTKFELVINLKTAKQIGLTIPPNVLARANRVIR